jgi:hypothetical protein
MGTSVHRIAAYQMRKIAHPVFPDINKYWFTVAAKDLPADISTAANARDPKGLNRRVYQDVRSSLDGDTAEVGTFDLMNKGITILAESVQRLVTAAATGTFSGSATECVGEGMRVRLARPV